MKSLTLNKGIHAILVFYIGLVVLLTFYLDGHFRNWDKTQKSGLLNWIADSPRKYAGQKLEYFKRYSTDSFEMHFLPSIRHPRQQSKQSSGHRRVTRKIYDIPFYPDFTNFTKLPVINFNIVYIITNEMLCTSLKNAETDVFVLVFVLSAAGNFERRQSIRQTYGSITSHLGLELRYLFILGRPAGNITQKRIIEESKESLDLIQFDFRDEYRKLVRKTVGGLQWVVRHCRNAKFVLKTDDDVMIFPQRLVRFLMQVKEDYVFAGRVVSGPAIRDKNSKWYVSVDQYPYRLYPEYNEGYGVLMSFPVVERFYQASRRIRLIPSEDAYLGLLASAARILPRCHSAMARGNVDLVNYVHCHYRNIMILEINRATEEKFIKTWLNYEKNNDESCVNMTYPIAFKRRCSDQLRPLNITVEFTG